MAPFPIKVCQWTDFIARTWTILTITNAFYLTFWFYSHTLLKMYRFNNFKIFVAFFSQEIVCLIFCHSSEHILISLNRYEIATGGRTVNYAKKSSFLLPCILFRLWYFNFESSFKLRWCRAQDLFGLQTPVATGGFVLVITCLREKFRINLLSLLFWNFEISRVKRGFKLSKSSHG